MIPDDAGQLILVLGADQAATHGILRCYARPACGAPWQLQFAPIPVCLGRGGIRSSQGGMAACASCLPAKQEGDGAAPAGVFTLGPVFGCPEQISQLGPLRMPWLETQAALHCVDDPASQYYNRLVDTRQHACDWSSSETMLRTDMRYALGVVIGHNPQGVPGAGSCIFLHVWGGPDVPTAGCTACALDDLRCICQWLDAARQPRLALLTEAEYATRQVAWGLPIVGRDEGAIA